MNTSMTLEERFEAIMKSCERIRAREEERANQNAYLRRQPGESIKQKGSSPDTSLAKHKRQPIKTRHGMSTRKLFKLSHELDSLILKTQQLGVEIQQFGVDLRQFGVDLHSMREIKGEVGQPFATNEVGENHEGNKVQLDLPPTFEEHEDQQDDDDKGACKAFIILDSPQKFEWEQVEPSLFSNGACHENKDVDWNLPPQFDELEVEEPQVLDSEPYSVVKEFEPHLIREECPYHPQELRTILFQQGEYDGYLLEYPIQPYETQECPYHQQELRTILFQQGEYDGYLLGHPIQPSKINSFYVASCPILAWVDLFSSPLFEFHDARHFMEFYMNFKIPFCKGAYRWMIGSRSKSIQEWSMCSQD